MQHPFINDLSGKTTEELQKTISDLYAKMNFVARSGNQGMLHQMRMVLESYSTEHQKRMDEMYKKHNLETQIQISKNDSKN